MGAANFSASFSTSSRRIQTTAPRQNRHFRSRINQLGGFLEKFLREATDRRRQKDRCCAWQR